MQRRAIDELIATTVEEVEAQSIGEGECDDKIERLEPAAPSCILQLHIVNNWVEHGEKDNAKQIG